MRPILSFMYKCNIVIFFALLIFRIGSLSAGSLSASDQELVNTVQQNFGSRAASRIIDWRKLVVRSLNDKWSIEKSITETNRFFNKLLFIDDITLWGKIDYWASPAEFLAVGGGDCEDFTIAKYFTLRQMGVPDDMLRLVYVKALKLNQFHMVLAYYPTPSSVPSVLDNLIPDVKTANLRSDLAPIYSFNGSHLWLMKEKGQGKLAGDASRLSAWTELQNRFSALRFNKPIMNLDN